MSFASLAESYRVYRDSIKTKRITTCADLYGGEGISVDVEYVDTMGQLSESERPVSSYAKVILCLHGAPGDHGTWRHQINYFTKKGYRVIAPNFPTYSFSYQTSKFNHSARERTQYMKDFLLAIGVVNLDIVMVHSAGFFTAVLLSEDPKFSISKMVFLAPGATYTLLQNPFVKFFGVNFRMFNCLYKRQGVRAFMEPVVKGFIGTASKVTSFVQSDHNHVLLQGAITSYTDVSELVTAIENLRKKLANNNLKILLMFSEKDELIPKAKFYALAEKLGYNEDSVEYYDIDEQLEKCRMATSQPWVTVFRTGNHIFFMKPSSVANEVINKFLMSNS